MTSRTYILIVILTGVGITIYLSLFMPTMVQVVVPVLMSAGLVGIPMLAKIGETEAKVDNAIVVSKQNAAALEVVSGQVDENTIKTEAVHTIVNSQRTEMERKIQELADLVAALRTEKAVTAGVQQQKDDDDRAD